MPSVPPDRPWAESGARPVFVFVGPGISLTGAYHMFRAAELLFCNSSGYQALAPVMYDHQEGCAPGARVPAARQRAGGWQHQGGQTGRCAGARRPRVVMHALGFACLLACCYAAARGAWRKGDDGLGAGEIAPIWRPAQGIGAIVRGGEDVRRRACVAVWGANGDDVTMETT